MPLDFWMLGLSLVLAIGAFLYAKGLEKLR
jgi:hypothetical protein